MHIPPQDAGTGYIIDLRHYSPNGKQTLISFPQVAFGDVWICSGQSNMEMELQKIFNAADEIRKIVQSTPEMRLFTVKDITSKEPNEDWEPNNIEYTWTKAGDNDEILR